MKRHPTTLICIGTRPEIIKMAPVYHEMRARGLRPLLLHTGQHTDLAKASYDLFRITPDYTIDMPRAAVVEKRNSASHTLAALQATLLHHISEVMVKTHPSLVLVHGDTASAFASALAAFYHRCPVAHVEAGLRSHNAYNPFPEEMNRTLISQIARWHFAPTPRARNNLVAEGVKKSHIHMVGNTIVEAVKLGISTLDHTLEKEGYPNLIRTFHERHAHQKIMMVTVHRRETRGKDLTLISKAVATILKKFPDVVVIWPVHPNPEIQQVVHTTMAHLPQHIAERLYLTEHLPYQISLWFVQNAWLLLTDSGGLQEEAAVLGTPVMVLRNFTERPEVIESGAGMIVGTHPDNIVQQVSTLHQRPDVHQAMRVRRRPYGNGTTASRICDIVQKELASWQAP